MAYMIVTVPQLAWYGDSELALEFPDYWDVTVCRMMGDGRGSITREEILQALRNPIGTKPLAKLAEGREDVAIVFDDMTRPTKIYEVAPLIIEELRKAGVRDENIRFICANGAHGTFNRIDFSKKLGEGIVEGYSVFNHNPYSNVSYLGHTRFRTPIELNSEFLGCDLKIAIGCILPHPHYGFSGGAKIILPGIASIRTISFNHGDIGGGVYAAYKVMYGRVNEENAMRQDAEEAAQMAKLDFIVNVLVNTRRDSTHIFTGDFVEAQRRGVEEARKHYKTESMPGVDVVISNAYSKASEAAIAAWPASTLKEGGTIVIVCQSPIGQIAHYVHGRWGIKKVGGDLWYPPPGILRKAGRVILLSQYLEKSPWLEIVPDKALKVKSWSEVLEEIRNIHGVNARIAVYPDATIQF